MKPEVIDALLQINERFYAEQAQDFSSTRGSAWKGWSRCVPFIEQASLREGDPTCRVLDAACGNLRFEAFLGSVLPGIRFEFTAVDNCAPLAGEYACDRAGARECSISFRQRDIVSALRDSVGSDEARFWSSGESCQHSYDVAVSFGFMHHIPTRDLRARLLQELVSAVRPGGYVAVSFWEFMSDPSLAKKAAATHSQAVCDMDLRADDLEANDFIIGWGNEAGAYRYCHSFTSAEVDELLDAVGCRDCAVDRYFADGRTGALNEYVVLQLA